MKKAYVLTADDCGSIIVFAETRGKARAMACYMEQFDWLDDTFTGVEIRREDWADVQLKNANSDVLEWGGNEKFYRSIEWYENEGNMSEVCRECGLYEFESIPESKLIYPDKGTDLEKHDPTCKGCLNGKP